MKKALKNSSTAFLANVVAVLIGFLTQKIFIQKLGIECLGLNGLFSNIVSMLGIAELGISSAIIYHLYGPVKRGDKTKIKSLVRFYQKAYRIIACVILGLGALLMPFLHLFISGPVPDVNIYIIYGLFLLDTLASYLLVYRRSILYANEEGYITSLVHIGYLITMNLVQIAVLLATSNFYLFLIVKLLARIAENLIIHLIVCKKYAYLSDKNPRPLSAEVRKDIFIKIRALFLHKIAGFVISGTDNIIISVFLGLTTVGLYSNYYVIFFAAETILTQAIVALTPTIGHLLVDKNQKRNYDAFKKVRRITFAIAMLASLGLLVLTTPFIKLWLGSEYLLSSVTLLVLVIYFFQKLMRAAYMTFKEAAGIYHEDRFVPLVESAVNIVASVALALWLGLPGVFIGTILSSLVLWCFSYPKFVYKPLFGRSYRQYALETGAYFAVFAIILVPVFLLLTNMIK